MLEGLRELKTAAALDHAFRHSRDEDQFIRQMHTWFDAFRSLKLIHFLRAHILPSVSYAQLRDEEAFARIRADRPGLSLNWE